MHVVGQVGRWPIVRTDLLIGKNMVTAVLKCQWKVEGAYGWNKANPNPRKSLLIKPQSPLHCDLPAFGAAFQSSTGVLIGTSDPQSGHRMNMCESCLFHDNSSHPVATSR